jgi:hypothetical protein
VRIFALIGALAIAGGAYLLVDGGIRLSRCLTNDVFSYSIWSEDFWLLIPGNPDLGLSPNAHWFLRFIGGLIAAVVGGRVLKTATR